MYPQGLCMFHRDSNSLTLGRGVGYCDIEIAQPRRDFCFRQGGIEQGTVPGPDMGSKD